MAKNKRYTTPAGTAVFPALVNADTKFDVDGVYKTGLKLAADARIDGMSLIQFLEEQHEQNVTQRKKEANGKKIKEADLPFEIDEDTGQLSIKFKLKAAGMTRDKVAFTQRPAIFDAKGTPYKGAEIWGGSTIKVAFEVIPSYTALIGAGISLRMKAVQIIELKQGSSGAGDFGFGEEEGYETSEEEVEVNVAQPFDMEEGTATEYQASGDF